jgi:MFS family permease
MLRRPAPRHVQTQGGQPDPPVAGHLSSAARPNVLRSAPTFRRLWLARTLSNVGDGIAFVALVLLVHNRDRTGLAVGSLLLVQAIPRFLGPLAGTIADRVEQRALMIACDVANAALFGAIALWSPSLPLLLALAGTSSAVDTLFSPAGRSALPALVHRDDLLQANAWLGTSFNLQLALGPMIGGAIVLALGPTGALAANIISFLLSAVILSRLPPLRSAGDEEQRGFFTTGTEGLRFAWETPVVRTVVVALFFAVAFAAMDNVALVFLVRDTLGGGPLAFGLLSAAFGVGMVAVSTGLSLRLIRLSAGAIFLAGWFFNGVGILLTGLAPALIVAGVGQVLAGCGNGAENIGVETLIQRTVPRPLLGRTFGVASTAAFGGSTLAYAVSGFLLDATSPRTVFVIGGSGVLLVTLFLMALVRQRLTQEAATV